MAKRLGTLKAGSTRLAEQYKSLDREIRGRKSSIVEQQGKLPAPAEGEELETLGSQLARERLDGGASLDKRREVAQKEAELIVKVQTIAQLSINAALQDIRWRPARNRCRTTLRRRRGSRGRSSDSRWPRQRQRPSRWPRPWSGFRKRSAR